MSVQFSKPLLCFSGLSYMYNILGAVWDLGRGSQNLWYINYHKIGAYPILGGPENSK